MKRILQSAVSLILGFVGGIIATRIYPPKPPALINAGIVRAERFELADGPTLPPDAYWGRDEHGGFNIAFFNSRHRVIASFGIGPSQYTKYGPTAFTPGLSLSGENGQPRLQAGLDSYEDPFLVMGTGEGNDRILLGPYSGFEATQHSKDAQRPWTLVFRDPSHGWRDYVILGMTTPFGSKVRTGNLVLQNSQGHELSQQPK
jgi:hypothetical protein